MLILYFKGGDLSGNICASLITFSKQKDFYGPLQHKKLKHFKASIPVKLVKASISPV